MLIQPARDACGTPACVPGRNELCERLFMTPAGSVRKSFRRISSPRGLMGKCMALRKRSLKSMDDLPKVTAHNFLVSVQKGWKDADRKKERIKAVEKKLRSAGWDVKWAPYALKIMDDQGLGLNQIKSKVLPQLEAITAAKQDRVDEKVRENARRMDEKAALTEALAALAKVYEKLAISLQQAADAIRNNEIEYAEFNKIDSSRLFYVRGGTAALNAAVESVLIVAGAGAVALMLGIPVLGLIVGLIAVGFRYFSKSHYKIALCREAVEAEMDALVGQETRILAWRSSSFRDKLFRPLHLPSEVVAGKKAFLEAYVNAKSGGLTENTASTG